MWIVPLALSGCAEDPAEQDLDLDGFSAIQGDCDDTDPDIAPGQGEVCDGVDQDCNGQIDDMPIDGQTYFVDDDDDGFGDDQRTLDACARPDGYAAEGGDCDDADPLIHPDGIDIEGEDRNCDGTIDFEPPNQVYEGPTLIDSASVTCQGSEVVFEVGTIGPAVRGIVFSQETAASIAYGPQYADEHDLDLLDADPLDHWSTLGQSLTHSVLLSDWIRNDSTVFRCPDHHGDLGYMTYAVGVYDDTNTLVDCIAFGHDPHGLIDGDFDFRFADPTFNLGVCAIAL